MKIRYEQLATSLKQKLAPVYLVSGDEPFQANESCVQIRTAAQENGYTEREIFHVERSFDWSNLGLSGNSLSLFSDRKLIELRMPAGKPGTEGSRAIVEFLDAQSDDTLLLIVTSKLDATAQRGKWVKAVESAGVHLPVWPIDAQRLPGWIQARLAKRGCTIDPDALPLLVDRVEGNLLAADQELEKLRLLYGEGRISLEQVQSAVADSSRYDVFSLVDECLRGNAARR